MLESFFPKHDRCIDLYTYIVVQRDRIWIFGKDDGTLFQDEGDETDFGMKGPSADL